MAVYDRIDVTRLITEAQYIVEKEATVREAAKVFGVSKSTIHKDVTERLRYFGFKTLCEDVEKVLQTNKQERHLRGGMATKLKHIREKNEEVQKKQVK